MKDLKVNKEKKTKGFFNDVSQNSGVLMDLVPYSKYKMYMVVANNQFEGPHSNIVEFQTKEGSRTCLHTYVIFLKLKN